MLSREQVAALDPTGRWSSLQYLVLLQKFTAKEIARNVPYSLEAVLFMISMKLTNPAQLNAFAYLVSHPKADFSKPNHHQFNMLYIIAQSRIPELWHVFFRHVKIMPPVRMNDRLVIDFNRLSPEMRKSLSRKTSIFDSIMSVWETASNQFYKRGHLF